MADPRPARAAVDLDAIQGRAVRAQAEIAGLANGSRKWTMCIPVQRDTDSDCVLIAPVDDVRDLVAEARRARARIVSLEAVLRRYTDLIDLDAAAYTTKYGATTHAASMYDALLAARAALGAT